MGGITLKNVSNYKPPTSGYCIRNCNRLACATPWLCFPCFYVVTKQWVIFHYTEYDEERSAALLKKTRNKIQRKSRKAFKNNNKEEIKMELKEAQVEQKLYIVTHNELSLQYQLPQCLHAAIQFANDFPEEQSKWFKLSNAVVILAAKSEADLIKFTERLDNNGFKYCKFYEPDINNALTAIAIVPGSNVRKVCSSLPLAGKCKNNIK